MVILSGPSQDLFKLPATVPSRIASRTGSESCAAAVRGGQVGAAARHWQPRPEPLPGGTATLQEILDTVPALAVVNSDELSLLDLDKEEWDRTSEAKDEPDPVKILLNHCDRYSEIILLILS